ncbi:MAG TPA: hypothetical protein PKY96_09705 [Flavobacteriales bacterium]|nr:hypothetical protein [Flavobacteriales bacterium]
MNCSKTDRFTIIINGDNKQVGAVRYSGSLNDHDPILITAGGSVPTNMRPGQWP